MTEIDGQRKIFWYWIVMIIVSCTHVHLNTILEWQGKDNAAIIWQCVFLLILLMQIKLFTIKHTFIVLYLYLQQICMWCKQSSNRFANSMFRPWKWVNVIILESHEHRAHIYANEPSANRIGNVEHHAFGITFGTHKHRFGLIYPQNRV